MDKIKEFLINWLENFVKNKDVLLKSILSIERNKKECDLYIEHKHKEHLFFIEPFIKDFNKLLNKLKKVDKAKFISLVVVNNKDNLKLVVKNWKTLVDLGAKFSIYFVNPFSELDHKWIIYPATHHRIADEASLERGLKSMFEMVGGISEKEFLDKV